jgi:hypothetical protein
MSAGTIESCYTQGSGTRTSDNTFTPGSTPNTVRTADGKALNVMMTLGK